MTQTAAALRTRPTAFQSEATAPTLGALPIALLMWKFQIRRTRRLTIA